MNKGIYIITGVFLAVVLGVFLFMRKPQTASQTSVGPTSSPSATSESGTAEEGVRKIEVIGAEYSFSPNTISLVKGEKVALTFKNMGRMPHNLVIDELGISTKTIQPGQSDTVEFTPSEVGIFAFYCSISNHRSMGMEGSLEVK